MPAVTPEKSILIQALALAECYVKLGELELSKDPLISENIGKIFGPTGEFLNNMELSVFKGQGALVSVFYMFLVLPHEWKINNVSDFGTLNLSQSKSEFFAKMNAIVENDYKDESYGALRHFRNALSHGRIYGREDGKLVIEDRHPNGKELYRAVYSYEVLGELAQHLSEAITTHLNTVMSQRPPKA